MLFDFNPPVLESICLLYNTSYCRDSSNLFRPICSEFRFVDKSFVFRISFEFLREFRTNFRFPPKTCCLTLILLIRIQFACFTIPLIVGSQAIYSVLYRISDLESSSVLFLFSISYPSFESFVRILRSNPPSLSVSSCSCRL